MINGNVNDFLDGIHWGEEVWLKYKGIVHFVQGWNEDGKFHLEHSIYGNDDVWEVIDRDNDVCVKAFLDAPLFDGKKFFDVEREIEWVDDEFDC